MIDLFPWIFGSMTTYRAVLAAAILLLAFMTLVLLVVLIVHKIYVEQCELQSARLRDKYSNLFPMLFDHQNIHLPAPKHSLSIDALADVAIQEIAHAGRDAAEHIRDEMRHNGAVDNLLHRLRNSRSWVRRHRALERLGFLKLPEMRQIYIDMLTREDNAHIISKALWALSYIAERQDLPLIIRYLGDSHFMSAKFNEYIFTNIIEEFRGRIGDDATLAILDALLADETIPVFLKRDVVEACGKIGYSGFAPLVIEAFHRFREVPEMRITALRAAGSLATDTTCEIITASLGDPDWRVRVVASNCAQNCRDASLSVLENLLGDPNYHVRINAATTLATFGERGKAVLNRAINGEDRFASDISRYVLSRAQ